MKKLTFVSNIDWVQLWQIVGLLLAFWSALAALTVIWPAFDTVYKVVNILLGAFTGAFLFAARSGKYVENRQELPPADGKP